MPIKMFKRFLKIKNLDILNLKKNKKKHENMLIFVALQGTFDFVNNGKQIKFHKKKV